ncbi:MAG: AMIN domain-containing protein [Myxococcaceae bacterium]
MTAPAPTARLERVPFARPVRVTPLEGGQPSLRLLGGNLSRSGMFLRSPLLLEPGTKVSLSLEAKGQTLPFAEGEVIWQREPAKASDGAHPGFGVKFTQFLHPRSPELVNALVTRGMEKLQQPPMQAAAPASANTDVATGPQTPSKEQLESFASPPPAFTELTLNDVPKEADEPAFVKSSHPLVVDLEKEPAGIPEVDLEDELDLAPPTSLRPTIGRVIGTAGFMLLILVPLVVAIGTWKASKTAEPAVQALEQSETRVVEFAQPVVAPVAVPVVTPVVTPVVAPVVNADMTPKVETVLKEKVETKQTPVAIVAPKMVAASKATLPLELAAVTGLSVRSTGNGLDLVLVLGSNATIRRAFALKSPDRLVIDVGGTAPRKSVTIANTKLPSVKQLRVGAQADGARLVFDLSKPVTNVKVAGSHVSAELR